jgi:hypothetical protein
VENHLRQFLQAIPQLSWIIDIQSKNFLEAARVLRVNGANEEALLPRRKTYFSLSKLAMLSESADQSGRFELPPEYRSTFEAEFYLIKLLEEMKQDAPTSVPDTINFLLNNRSLGSDERFEKALFLHQHCQMLIPALDRRLILDSIWLAALRATSWSEIADSLLLSDNRLWEHVQTMPFHRLLCSAARANYLDGPAVTDVIARFIGSTEPEAQRDTISRLLLSILMKVLSSKTPASRASSLDFEPLLDDDHHYDPPPPLDDEHDDDDSFHH